MKKLFTLLTGVLLAVGAQGQTITFTASDIASSGFNNKEFSNGAFKITLADDPGKMAIDANDSYFGTAETNQKLTHRLKSGAKSQGVGKLSQIAVTIPAAGELKVYARTGSNSATDRNLIITQGSSELYNKVVQESDAISVDIAENITSDNATGTTKVYPIISVSVTAGEALITYPAGSMNFYAFEFVEGGGTPSTPSDPHTATIWDFTTTTASSFGSGWSETSSGRYTYGTEIAADTYVDLGEIGFSLGAGISVGRSGGKLDANNIRVDIGKLIQLNTSNGVYKITGVAKDDKVSIRYKSASNEERKFTVTNGDVTELVAPKNSDENAEKTATITVAADGDLVLTQSKGINVYAISVNADLPTTGISTIKTETATDGTIYNLQGQRVDESYRGVVIKNGRKVVVK